MLLHPFSQVALLWQADLSRLVCGGSDGSITCWQCSASYPTKLFVNQIHTDSVRVITNITGMDAFATSGNDGKVPLPPSPTNQIKTTPSLQPPWAQPSILQSPALQMFLLDQTTHKVRRSYKGHSNTVHSICWEPSLKLILTASLASEIVGFSPYSDRELFRLVKHLVPVSGLCVRARCCLLLS